MLHSIVRILQNEPVVRQSAGGKNYLNNTDIFLFNNQPDTLIIQIYSVINLYMFRATSLPIIRSFLLYIRHW